MKRLLAVVSMGLLCGCNSTQFSRVETWTDKDGIAHTNMVSVCNRRCIWTTESYTASLSKDTARLTATKSTTDQETIQIMAQALVSIAQKAP